MARVEPIDEDCSLHRPYDTNLHSTCHKHRTQDDTHECPICILEYLEVPVVSDLLQSLLNVARSATAKISSQIDAVQAVLARMQSTKDACALSVEQHESAIHPICSIPDDILYTIFEWCTVLEGTGEDADTLSSTRAPWVLSYVSRRWRFLTLSSPRLWSYINILPDGHIPETFTFKWSLLFQRTSDCDLYIRAVELSGRETTPHDLLLTTARWRRLEISMDHSLFTYVANSSFDRLTELILFSVHFDPIMIGVFALTPRLTHLALWGLGDVDLAWERIESYTCGVDGIQHLRKLTEIEHCTLDLHALSQNTTFTFPMSEVLSLPTMRSISITQTLPPADTFPSIQEITQLLHLPMLDTLTLRSGRNPLPTFAGPLDGLRNLRLSTFALPDEILAFLAMHGSVMAFYAEDGVDVLRLLPVVAGHEILLPNLTSLRLNATWMVMDPECVVDILESRCGGRLDEVVIVGKDYQRRQVKGCMESVEGLSERWTVACEMFKVVEVDENSF